MICHYFPGKKKKKRRLAIFLKIKFPVTWLKKFVNQIISNFKSFSFQTEEMNNKCLIDSKNFYRGNPFRACQHVSISGRFCWYIKLVSLCLHICTHMCTHTHTNTHTHIPCTLVETYINILKANQERTCQQWLASFHF